MRRKPRRKGDRPIDFLKCRVVIFFVEAGLLSPQRKFVELYFYGPDGVRLMSKAPMILASRLLKSALIVTVEKFRVARRRACVPRERSGNQLPSKPRELSLR